MTAARTGRKKRTRGRAAPVPPPSRHVGRAGLLLFLSALAVRLLFWQATPDAAWPYSAWFKGDAPVWLEYAQALRSGRPFELGLPIHPPGAGYLVAGLWNGLPSGIPFLRFCWAAMGALGVALVYVAALRAFGFTVACMAGFLCAISTGLIILSSSINNETPYLLLVLGSLAWFEDVRRRPGLARIALWSAANGLACLIRVEHVLSYALLVLLVAALWVREAAVAGVSFGGRRIVARVASSLFFFALPLVPWHAAAWPRIARFNAEPRPLVPLEEAAVRGVEESLRGMPWDTEARRKIEELPGFVRRTGAAFVAATVAHRGGRQVRGEDVGILEEAFGYFPRPLARFPFVSSYGPLNFYLANHAGAKGGFDRSPLEEPPPLAGGPARYPRFLVQGLPPPDLSFVYPPHLRLFNEGYVLGAQAIRAQPARFAALVLRKLGTFWSGVALGVTGFNLPLGLAGTRRSVDLVVPVDGWATMAWGTAVLVVCLLGVAAAWRRPALYAWLLFLLSKVMVTVLFFGYARQGAMVIPVVALLAALAAERWLLPRLAPLPPRRRVLVAAAALALPVVVEAARWASRPVVLVDGLVVGAADPVPRDLHRDQRIEVVFLAAPKAGREED